MVAALDLTGLRFGKLVAVSLESPINGRRAFLCQCDCGNKKVVRSECLRSGITKSCGCIRNERIGNLNKTHCKSKSPEYKSWAHAKNRITNKNNKKYKDYGGRGITMCQEWLDSFDAFYRDMGPKPSNKHSIGRIDVNKGYFKENCRWENFFEQARSRTDNVYVKIKGKKLILKDACAMYNLNYKVIHQKIKYGKVSITEIFHEI